MKNINENSRYFRISSFYIAAFLFTKGMELVSLDRISDSKRAYFVFVDSPERELLMESFNFGKENAPETMVDARKFMMAIKQLKEKLFQDKF